jgi:hypothetical protein
LPVGGQSALVAQPPLPLDVVPGAPPPAPPPNPSLARPVVLKPHAVDKRAIAATANQVARARGSVLMGRSSHSWLCMESFAIR